MILSSTFALIKYTPDAKSETGITILELSKLLFAITLSPKIPKISIFLIIEWLLDNEIVTFFLAGFGYTIKLETSLLKLEIDKTLELFAVNVKVPSSEFVLLLEVEDSIQTFK